MLFEKREYLRN